MIISIRYNINYSAQKSFLHRQFRLFSLAFQGFISEANSFLTIFQEDTFNDN